jgi:hypothetical protein
MSAVKISIPLETLAKRSCDDLKQAFANEFLDRVKERTPVDTGLLKDSWTITVNKGSISLKNDAKNSEGQEYVGFREFGTYKMPGAFMVSTTILEKQDILRVAKKNAGL